MSEGVTGPIKIPAPLWRGLIFELRAKCGGVRESGAFLLRRASTRSMRVRSYICYDVLDSSAYQNGAISFHASGYAALWEYCREQKLEVLADVHVHPGHSVQQSPTDQRNPMLPVVGHTAIILPNFARTPWWSLKEAGVYEHLGEFRWRTHSASARSAKVKLVLW